MEREIKFRGELDDGNFGYGDLIHDDVGMLIRTDKGQLHRVKKVSQLIEKDMYGKEIFEDDFCEWANAISMPFKVSFDHYVLIKQGEVVLSE